MKVVLVLPIPRKVCRMTQASAEKLEQTGPVENKRASQSEQLARTPETPLPKSKRT